MVRIVFIGWFIFISIGIRAQNVNAFAMVKSSRNTVLVEQGLKVTVTVYTSTWFTKPLQIENLQVEGAFVQSFRQTLSSIKYIDKQKYATLEFYYIVFPYQDGELTFPELSIITETPPEGDYKGKLVTLKTKPITINVKPIPKNADSDRWLVASNASISNQWNSDLKNLKVGDVVKRTIITKASGTLPSFIDEPLIGDVDFGNIYASEPKYFDERDSKSVNGKRVDDYSYLLEQEGEFTIPEVEITWYNPYVGKFYKKKLPAYTIFISENKDLAALVSLKDSLNALNPTISADLLESNSEVSYKRWALIGAFIILAILVLFTLYKITVKLIIIHRKRQIDYRNSEAYWFNGLLQQQDEKKILIYLYKWLDYSFYMLKNNTLNTFAKDDENLGLLCAQLKKNNFSASSKVCVDLDQLRKDIVKHKKTKLHKNGSDTNNSSLLPDDINPRQL